MDSKKIVIYGFRPVNMAGMSKREKALAILGGNTQRQEVAIQTVNVNVKFRPNLDWAQHICNNATGFALQN